MSTITIYKELKTWVKDRLINRSLIDDFDDMDDDDEDLVRGHRQTNNESWLSDSEKFEDAMFRSAVFKLKPQGIPQQTLTVNPPPDCNINNQSIDAEMDQIMFTELDNILNKQMELIDWLEFGRRQVQFTPTHLLKLTSTSSSSSLISSPSVTSTSASAAQSPSSISSFFSKKQRQSTDEVIGLFEQSVFLLFPGLRLFDNEDGGVVIGNSDTSGRGGLVHRSKMAKVLKCAQSLCNHRFDYSRLQNVEQYLFTVFIRQDVSVRQMMKIFTVMLFISVGKKQLESLVQCLLMCDQISIRLLHSNDAKFASKFFTSTIASFLRLSLSTLGNFSLKATLITSNSSNTKKKDVRVLGKTATELLNLIPTLSEKFDAVISSSSTSSVLALESLQVLLFAELDRLISEFEVESQKVANLEKLRTSFFQDIPFCVQESSCSALASLLLHKISSLSSVDDVRVKTMRMFISIIIVRILGINIANTSCVNRSKFADTLKQAVMKVLEICSHRGSEHRRVYDVLERETKALIMIDPVLFFFTNGIANNNDLSLSYLIQSSQLTIQDNDSNEELVRIVISIVQSILCADRGSSDCRSLKKSCLTILFQILSSFKERVFATNDSLPLFTGKCINANSFLAILFYLSKCLNLADVDAETVVDVMNHVEILLLGILKQPNSKAKERLSVLLLGLYAELTTNLIWYATDQPPTEVRRLVDAGARVFFRIDRNSLPSNISGLTSVLSFNNLDKLLQILRQENSHSEDLINKFDQQTSTMISECIKLLFVCQIHHANLFQYLIETLRSFNDGSVIAPLYVNIWRFAAEKIMTCYATKDKNPFGIRLQSIKNTCESLLSLSPHCECNSDCDISIVQDAISEHLTSVASPAVARQRSFTAIQMMISLDLTGTWQAYLKNQFERMVTKFPAIFSSATVYSSAMAGCDGVCFTELVYAFTNCYKSIMSYFDVDYDNNSKLHLGFSSVLIDMLIYDLYCYEGNSLDSWAIEFLLYSTGCDAMSNLYGESDDTSIRSFSLLNYGPKLSERRRRDLILAFSKLFEADSRHRQTALGIISKLLRNIPRALDICATGFQKRSDEFEINCLFGVMYILFLKDGEILLRPGDIIRLEDLGIDAVIDVINADEDFVSLYLPNAHIAEDEQSPTPVKRIEVPYSKIKREKQASVSEAIFSLPENDLWNLTLLATAEWNPKVSVEEFIRCTLQSLVISTLSKSTFPPFIFHNYAFLKKMKDFSKKPLNFIDFMNQETKCTYMHRGKQMYDQIYYHCKSCDMFICKSCARTCHSGHDLDTARIQAFYCECYESDRCSYNCNGHSVPHNMTVQTRFATGYFAVSQLRALHKHLTNSKQFMNEVAEGKRIKENDKYTRLLPSQIVCESELRSFYDVNTNEITAKDDHIPPRMLTSNYCYPSSMTLITYSIQLTSFFTDSVLAFGLAPCSHDMKGLPGWSDFSVGFHTDEALLYIADRYSDPTTISAFEQHSLPVPGDEYRFCFSRDTGKVDVMKNGKVLVSGQCEEVKRTRLYPVLYVNGKDTSLRVKFSFQEESVLQSILSKRKPSDMTLTTTYDEETTIGWMRSSESQNSHEDGTVNINQSDVQSNLEQNLLREIHACQLGAIMVARPTAESVKYFSSFEKSRHPVSGKIVVVADMIQHWDRVNVVSVDSLTGQISSTWLMTKDVTTPFNYPFLKPTDTIEDFGRIVLQYFRTSPVLYTRTLFERILTDGTATLFSALDTILGDAQALSIQFAPFIQTPVAMNMFWTIVEDLERIDDKYSAFHNFFLKSAANMRKCIETLEEDKAKTLIQHLFRIYNEDCVYKYIRRNDMYVKKFHSNKETHTTEIFIPYAKGLKLRFHPVNNVLHNGDELKFSTNKNFETNYGEEYTLSSDIQPQSNINFDSNRIYFKFNKSSNDTNSQYSFSVTPNEIQFTNEEAMIENYAMNPSMFLWVLNIFARLSSSEKLSKLIASNFRAQIKSMVKCTIKYLSVPDASFKSSIIHLTVQILGNLGQSDPQIFNHMGMMKNNHTWEFSVQTLCHLFKHSTSRYLSQLDLLCFIWSQITDNRTEVEYDSEDDNNYGMADEETSKIIEKVVNLASDPTGEIHSEMLKHINLQNSKNEYSVGRILVSRKKEIPAEDKFSVLDDLVKETSLEQDDLAKMVSVTVRMSPDCSVFIQLFSKLQLLSPYLLRYVYAANDACDKLFSVAIKFSEDNTPKDGKPVSEDNYKERFGYVLSRALDEVFNRERSDGLFVYNEMQDMFYLNPALTTQRNMEHFEFLGKLLALMLQTHTRYEFNLDYDIWKFLVSEEESLVPAMKRQMRAIQSGMLQVIPRSTLSFFNVLQAHELQQYMCSHQRTNTGSTSNQRTRTMSTIEQ